VKLKKEKGAKESLGVQTNISRNRSKKGHLQGRAPCGRGMKTLLTGGAGEGHINRYHFKIGKGT